MLQNGFHVEENSGGGAVLVGIRLDAPSRELLTWALVKVAQPGDCVIALHVLGKNEIFDRDGKSSLLSLVKAFDSVLAVYEGFCNLKQVDLKLKICRGASAKKILVREAESYSAAKLIVGTAHNHHKIRSTTSVAKYCAKKLPKTCGVLAVNNGKVVFNREGSPEKTADKQPQGVEQDQQSRIETLKGLSDASLSVGKQSCEVCEPVSSSLSNQVEKDSSRNGGGEEDMLMALVPVQKAEPAPSPSISVLIKELPEVRPGWPLLRRAAAERKSPERTLVRKISVVEWAMQLPSRPISCASDADRAQFSSENEESSNLDSESGAIVAVGAAAAAEEETESKSLPRELEGLHEKYSSACRLFNYKELSQATSSFWPENLIGRGGSSEVYRGSLPDGKELAVKILKPSDDVIKEFVLEIEIITTLHHKNIISLLGFCFEDNNLLLVYDFLSRGSLEENLHGKKKDSLAFGWIERYKVALGVAEAVDYLHGGNSQPVIHRDVKSSNILLSGDFEPQLSDFGLAKWASTTTSHITCTDVAGTFGYLAPEYFMYGKVNNKIDVYAFGVVLLELLSGRKPISSDYPKGQESLVMWAKPILNEGKVSKLLDPSLGGSYDQDRIERMVLAATLCIRRAPRARPQMSLVVKLLQGDPEVIKWARLQMNSVKEADIVDDEAGCPRSNLQSHLNLALLDVEDDSLSMSSIEQSVSLEDYLQGRWSRSSSFD
ncbi:Proline-rich receptor-like protein kinase PERK1 [Morus notabilis]|uniref:Proline-rich receptor-like protein kinase PERK1 n=1 Tax=Morus notabilis TaxID=981085 RepID=W9QCU0_9ROSA|nr:LRR receptor kinase SERK2 [Morus notabilis]EXB28442.1 Proline-rich receptor-like protein kinase PERK1 [Morus notabilis]